jgi:hypothetical protein
MSARSNTIRTMPDADFMPDHIWQLMRETPNNIVGSLTAPLPATVICAAKRSLVAGLRRRIRGVR